MDYLAFRLADELEIDRTLNRVLNDEPVSFDEAHAYQTALLLYCAKQYSAHNIVLQIHFSCMRNPNSKMFAALGQDSGFDAMAEL